MALLSLGLYQGFIVSYLDLKVPTKVVLSMDGCYIIIVEGFICERDILLCHLADITSILMF